MGHRVQAMSERDYRIILAIIVTIGLALFLIFSYSLQASISKERVQKECIRAGGSWTATLSPSAEYCVMPSSG